MNKSESIAALAKALAQAQGKIRGAIKDSANPFFKTKYADLASVVEAIRDALSEAEIAYIQMPEPTDKEEVRMETMLVHASGEWVSGVLVLPVTKADAQGYGSALTYARRYGLAAAVGVAPEDDDGNAAVAQTARRPAPARPATTPTAPPDDPDQMLRVTDAADVEKLEQAERLRLSGEEDANTLIGRIIAGFSKLRMSPDAQRVTWSQHCGGASFLEPCDVAALAALLADLRARAKAAR